MLEAGESPDGVVLPRNSLDVRSRGLTQQTLHKQRPCEGAGHNWMTRTPSRRECPACSPPPPPPPPSGIPLPFQAASLVLLSTAKAVCSWGSMRN